jgi:hypothetical protein
MVMNQLFILETGEQVQNVEWRPDRRILCAASTASPHGYVIGYAAAARRTVRWPVDDQQRRQELATCRLELL